MPQAKFIAAGHFGLCLVSDDGKTWKESHKGKEGEVWRGSAAAFGRAVLVGTYGGSNILQCTRDGQEWKRFTKDGKYSRYLRGLTTTKDEFVGLGGDPGSVGSSRPFIMASKDGVEWSDFVDVTGKEMIRRAAFGDGRLVGVGDRGRRAASLDGGRTWEDVQKVKAIDTLVDVAFGAGCFVGVGLHGLRMRSVDGLVWEEKQLGDEGEHINSILWAENRFTAIGQGATWISPDGKSWEKKPNHDAPHTAVYGPGFFIGLNWKGRILHSADALQWNEVHRSEHHLETLSYGVLDGEKILYQSR